MQIYDKAIEINDLTKKYDGFTLDHLSLSVPRGSIMGYIGQNGAGKTTTIKAILNMIAIDEGEIRLLGMDHRKQERQIKEKMAVVFDSFPFPELFNALQLGRMLRGIYKAWNEETYKNYISRFNLPIKKKVGTFSKGMKMKLQIAIALSHKAELLIMDEATSGLDPIARAEVLDIFYEFLQKEENSILMSSHIISDIEKIADCVTFIDKGKVLLCGNKDELLEKHGMIKCSLGDYRKIDQKDMISSQITDFGATVLIDDQEKCRNKYGDMLIERTSLEEMMCYYVNKGKEVMNHG